MLVPSLQHVATVALACYVSIGLAVPNVQSVTDTKALNEVSFAHCEFSTRPFTGTNIIGFWYRGTKP